MGIPPPAKARGLPARRLGEKTAAVLSMQEYRLLMQHLEDLEDILDMDTAAKGETHFRDYREIQAELKKEGKL